MKRRHRATCVSHERWLVSYADFITLLFAFFVVLYATAQVDRKKVGQLSAAIQVAFEQLGMFQPGPAQPIPAVITPVQTSKPSSNTALVPQDMQALKHELDVLLAHEISKQEVALHITPDGLVLSLRELGFFESGSAVIRPQAEAAFAKIAGVLTQHSYAIRIEGHTDTVPIHTAKFRSNWELSTARATEIVRLLIVQYSYDPARLAAAGYAEFHPVADNRTVDGRQTNRRVDLVVLMADQTQSAKAQTATSDLQTENASPTTP
jgi:chemotaxis protein MotB